MTKREFLERLEKSLSGLPQNDLKERLSFYGEMIDDRMEEGVSEEEAVQKIGDIDQIASAILSEIPALNIQEKAKPKSKLKAWEIVLLVLGSPIWLSLLISAVAVALSLYASLWVVIISLWAVFGSLAGSAVGGLAAGIIMAFTQNTLSSAAVVGAALVCAGLSIFAFFGCKAATKGTVLLTKKIAMGIKNKLKGEAK